MSSFLQQCVDKYRELTDYDGEFPYVATPFLTASEEDGPACAPANRNRHDDSGATPGASGEEEEQGTVAKVAMQILMKVLYSARFTRLDLLRAVQGLARWMSA